MKLSYITVISIMMKMLINVKSTIALLHTKIGGEVKIVLKLSQMLPIVNLNHNLNLNAKNV